MNYNYILKQPIVQAFQLTKERWEDRSDWPWWMTEEVARSNGMVRREGVDLIGEWVAWDNWIIYWPNTGKWETMNPFFFTQLCSPYLGQRGSFGARDE